MVYKKVTRPPEEKKFGGRMYSVVRSYPRIPSYPSSKSFANEVANSYRKSGYKARVVDFNLTTIGGKYPTTKRVWYVYTR